MQINQDDRMRNTTWYLPSKQTWLDKVHRQLLSRRTVTVPFLLYRAPNSQEIRKLCFNSLDEFFRKLSSPAVEPVTMISQGNELDRKILELRQKAQDLDTANFPEMPQDPRADGERERQEAVRLLAAITTVREVLLSIDWEMIQMNDIERLLDQNHRHLKGWTKLYDTDFYRAVKIRRTLEDIKSILSNIYI